MTLRHRHDVSSFIYATVKRRKDVPNVMMMSQHGQGCSNWSLKWVISFGYYAVRIFFRVSGSSVFWRYQLVRCHNVSKTLVSLMYHLWRLWDVLSWSVSLRYQVVRRYDVSVWSYCSVLFTYQWDVRKTSQIGPSHWFTNFDVMMTSQRGLRRSNQYETYMRRRYEFACSTGPLACFCSFHISTI